MMLLIWGFKARMKTLADGTFYSPAAGGDAPYRLVEARRWFTFFWIPIIPLKVLGTFVECQATGATYDPTILDNPTNADFADQLTSGVREVIAHVVMADGVASDEERRLAIEVVASHVPGYDEASLDSDLARVADAPLEARLTYLAGSLNERGKEQLLTAAATVMIADGVIGSEDRDAVESIGAQLTMSPAHVRGVIEIAGSAISAADGDAQP